MRPDPKFDAINVVSICVQDDSVSTVDTYVLMRGNSEEYRRRFAITFVLPSTLAGVMPIILSTCIIL